MYEYAVRTDLQSITTGIDRGVAIPAADSSGNAFDIKPVNRKRISKRERQIRRYQRRMARQMKGSCNYRKNKQKVAKLKGYAANVRKDFAHKTSFALVNSDAKVFVFEDLKLKNMTAAPKAKVDTNGRFIRNGAAAKAGLNKSMLASALGLVKQYAAYKAAAVNKLALVVPAHHTSQECSVCHHVDSLNRLSQEAFQCVNCGHTENADMNAAKVIKHRGVQVLQKHLQALEAGTARVKTKKAVRVRRAAKEKEMVGLVLPEPAATLPTLVARQGDLSGQSASDAANDSFVYGAMPVEARNPHLQTAGFSVG
jgi:putative transposase